jgi:putative nucleotidyltransferase with HDIG domain
LPHYVAFGAVGGAIALAYSAIGLYGLAVFVLPLFLMRKTMAAYLGHTEKSTKKLRKAAETIRQQNVSLEQANRLLKERSTAAMESLSATVDARDAYTAGHSRRVQQLALAIGRELGLSQAELDLLGHAALFHDIGKLAIPDAILLKPASLTPDEWALMQRHADEGARIIDRLGFLQDAVPAIRHHHERFDGTGYPDGIAGEEIPLGARIIHVAVSTVRRARPTRLSKSSGAGPAASSARAASRRSNACFTPRSPARPSRPRSSSPPPDPLAGRLACSILCGDRHAPVAALHRRDAPRRAPWLCKTPRTLADDARVLTRCPGEAASTDHRGALRQLERGEETRRARRAAVRHP